MINDRLPPHTPVWCHQRVLDVQADMMLSVASFVVVLEVHLKDCSHITNKENNLYVKISS